jgi:quinol monooxygenase YgiN
VIIIAGHLRVDPAERDGRVSAFRDLVSRCRAAEGCLDVAMTADSVDPDRINMIEIWRNAQALDAWRAQADAPELGEPREMDVKRYDATDGGPLF